MEIYTIVKAMINENQFLSFSLTDVFNINFLLSMIPSSSLYEVDVFNDANLSLKRFDFFFDKIFLKSNCVSCSSPGMYKLSKILNF